jgi:hypothetical protein
MQPVANIAVWNAAATPIEFDLTAFVKAMQVYVDDVMVPVWGRPAKLTLSDGPISGQWGMVFMDDADAPGALAYHTVDDGMPLAKVFVKTILANGETISGGATHELAEMLVDPTCSVMVAHPGGGFYAYECCDPVEENTFIIDGFPVSDLVFPRYFEPMAQDGKEHQYNWMKTLKAPFALEAGGYQSIYLNGKWSEVFGCHAKLQRYAKEDRRGHRSEYRRACTPSQ